MSNWIIQYRAAVENLLRLQQAAANDFPPNQYEGAANLVQESLAKMVELEWLMRIYGRC